MRLQFSDLIFAYGVNYVYRLFNYVNYIKWFIIQLAYKILLFGGVACYNQRNLS